MGRRAKNKYSSHISVMSEAKQQIKRKKDTQHSELEKGKLSAQLGKASIKEEAIKWNLKHTPIVQMSTVPAPSVFSHICLTAASSHTHC